MVGVRARTPEISEGEELEVAGRLREGLLDCTAQADWRHCSVRVKKSWSSYSPVVRLCLLRIPFNQSQYHSMYETADIHSQSLLRLTQKTSYLLSCLDMITPRILSRLSIDLIISAPACPILLLLQVDVPTKNPTGSPCSAFTSVFCAPVSKWLCDSRSERLRGPCRLVFGRVSGVCGSPDGSALKAFVHPKACVKTIGTRLSNDGETFPCM